MAVRARVVTDMEYTILLRANWRRHRGGLLGIFVLVTVVCLSMALVLALWSNSGRYVRREMERLGYGDLTVWVSGVPDLDAQEREVSAAPDVEQTSVQRLIYSDYELNGQESDSQGQLIAFDRHPYRFFNETLSGYIQAPSEIVPGTLYAPASIKSMFGAEIGDKITFPIARNGVQVDFTIAGWYEDPFMGSSMIGMKGFLICEVDRAALEQTVLESSIDALAQEGAMLHIFRAPDSPGSMAEWGERLNGSTSLPQFTQFSHSADTISGFMLILQNAFAGLLLAFTAVLLAVTLLVLAHSIHNTITADTANLGILKTVGCTGPMLRRIQISQYALPVLGGMAAGTLLALALVPVASRMTVTTTGVLVPGGLPVGLCALSLGIVLLILLGFIILRTAQVQRVTPLQAIREAGHMPRRAAATPLRREGLSFWLALRQLASGWRRYLGACAVAVLLVFFACLVGRLNAWLGPNGQGLMDAFNPANHDLGIQIFGALTVEETESFITARTPITDRYLLAMPNASVGGTDYTVNVINQPERFHILRGRTCMDAGEVVLTEFLAADLGVDIGDTVTVSASGNDGEYRISGIYQCANDMGANLGMSREGYERLGEVRRELWCTHYFLENPEQKMEIMEELENAYGGDIHVHENAWPGLYGILGAMRTLMSVMYAMIALVVLVVVSMTAGRLLSVERRDMGLCRAMGFSAGRLRRSFALRFALVSLTGAALGTLASVILSDPMVAKLMASCGISGFAARPDLGTILLPGIIVTALFTLFAWLSAWSIRAIDLPELFTE